MRILLVSTYDLGHQPFGLAQAAAYLEQRGHTVDCADIAVGTPNPDSFGAAHAIAFYLPMHAATRLAIPWIRRARQRNPKARIGAFGLYAQLNAGYLRELGVHWIAQTPLAKNALPVLPNRRHLKPLERYARLQTATGPRLAAYTEASYGCKHLCRHCPIVPVYQGQFRIVPRDAVLADIRQQAAAGATHVTFGDPDFFNGPRHAAALLEAFHREFPTITYDVTIKVEHLLRHRDLLPTLRSTGCSFITSAVESLDDAVLEKLRKGHSRRDFFEVVELLEREGLVLSPTFIAFTPWTTLASYRDLLETIRRLNFVENTASVQLALRLLIPNGSPLLELEEVRRLTEGYDPPSLLWRWRHPDPAVDALAVRCLQHATRPTRRDAFQAMWLEVFREPLDLLPRAAIPYLDEPWYC